MSGMDRNSLGPIGPNVTSVEPVSETVYSVEGHNLAQGFRVEVRDGVGQTIEGATVIAPTETKFTLTLPFVTTGPYTLVVINPDGRTSTEQFATPGTNASNLSLRANS